VMMSLVASVRCATALQMPSVFAFNDVTGRGTRRDYWRMAGAMFAAGFDRS
jgi:hypothetical protein